MTGHKKYIQFSGNMVQSPLKARMICSTEKYQTLAQRSDLVRVGYQDYEWLALELRGDYT